MTKGKIIEPDELMIVLEELEKQKEEKEKLNAELTLARLELAYQKEEKRKRVDELGIANEELGIIGRDFPAKTCNFHCMSGFVKLNVKTKRLQRSGKVTRII